MVSVWASQKNVSYLLKEHIDRCLHFICARAIRGQQSNQLTNRKKLLLLAEQEM